MPGGKRHTVETGDRLSSIAARYHVDPAKLWALHDNRELAARRHNPEMLVSGTDEVALPEGAEEQHEAPDAQAHSFVCDAANPELRIRVVVRREPPPPPARGHGHARAHGPPPPPRYEPLAGQPFELSLPPFVAPARAPFATGTTDADGRIADASCGAIHIPPAVTEARLSFPALGFEMRLTLGHLRPASEPATPGGAAGRMVRIGVQQRLNNLGYFCPIRPPASDPAKDPTLRALARFQEDFHAGPDEAAWLAALEAAHEPAAPAAWSASPAATTAAPASPPPARPFPWREYHATTNTNLTLVAPTLTVTVRNAMFVPKHLLPSEDRLDTDPVELRGRETWYAENSSDTGVGIAFTSAVLAALDVSTEPWDHWRPVAFRPLTAPAEARERTRASGLATTILYSRCSHYYRYDRDTGDPAHIGRLFSDAANRRPKHVGEVEVSLLGLRAGLWMLKLAPPAAETSPQPDEPAGPTTVIQAGANFTFRPLLVILRLNDNLEVTEAVTARPDARGLLRRADVRDPDPVNWGYVTAFAPDELALGLKPDFIRTHNTHDASRAKTEAGTWDRGVSAVIVHETDGAIIDRAISMVVKSYGPSYEIDLDGHVVKFAYDQDATGHAGRDAETYLYAPTLGRAQNGLNAFTIGIEVVNREAEMANPPRAGRIPPPAGFRLVQEPYRAEQIAALATLVGKLVRTHGVPRYRVVGHGDVVVTPGTLVLNDDRISCPGIEMDWAALERAGLGWSTAGLALATGDYGGIFDRVAAFTSDDVAVLFGKDAAGTPEALFSLRTGDRDDAARWGRLAWRGGPMTAILARTASPAPQGVLAAVQGDLQTLGYSVNTDGAWSARTDECVKHFLYHLCGGPRGGPRRGLAAGAPEGSPRPLVTRTVATYLRTIARNIETEVAITRAVTGALTGSVPPPPIRRPH